MPAATTCGVVMVACDAECAQGFGGCKHWEFALCAVMGYMLWKTAVAAAEFSFAGQMTGSGLWMHINLLLSQNARKSARHRYWSFSPAQRPVTEAAAMCHSSVDQKRTEHGV